MMTVWAWSSLSQLDSLVHTHCHFCNARRGVVVSLCQKIREGSLEPSLISLSMCSNKLGLGTDYWPEPEVLAAVVSGALGTLR